MLTHQTTVGLRRPRHMAPSSEGESDSESGSEEDESVVENDKSLISMSQ